MYESPSKRGLPWLVAGLLLLVVSIALYLFDLDRTDKEIFANFEQQLQADFTETLNFYSTRTDSAFRFDHLVCKLTYDEFGRLSTWTNNEYLPPQQTIFRLEELPDAEILALDRRNYYQIRHTGPNSTQVILIPILIEYEVRNNYLLPYVFLGDQASYFTGSSNQRYLQNLFVDVTDLNASAEVQIVELQGGVVFTIGNIPSAPFRAGVRYAVLLFLVLGLCVLGVYLRIYSLYRWPYRYFINVSLFFGILLIRAVMFWVNIPGDYWESELFTPNILGFDPVFAPSLGDFTINVVTVVLLVWIFYLHFFRMTSLWYRKVIRNHFVAWPAMMLTIFLSSYLFKFYIDIFSRVIVSSQVEIDFSNIFKADLFSFLILLDVGMILLSLSLVVFLLLKLNVLYGRRFGNTFSFLLVQILAILVSNLYLHVGEPDGWGVAFTLTVAMALMAGASMRQPFRAILDQDLINYLLIMLVFSLVVTHNVIIGQKKNQEIKATRIAEKVLGKQVVNTVANFRLQSQRMTSSEKDENGQDLGDLSRIQNRWILKSSISEFKNWLKESYLTSKFKEFEVSLFLYDTAGVELGPEEDIFASFPPNVGIPLGLQGDSIAPNLFQFTDNENVYLDTYVGQAFLALNPEDTLTKTLLHIEMFPSRRETEGLYLSLTLDDEVFESIQLINSCEHAIYKEGFLQYERGAHSFPLYLENFERFQTSTTYEEDDFVEYIEPIENNRLVIVRYQAFDWLDIITTFSFIFYFYILATLILVALPVMILRSIRSGHLIGPVPLRAKIRLGLLTISVLPMVVIILLLSPFIRDRYTTVALEELHEEAERIKNYLSQDYIKLAAEPFTKVTSQKEFQTKVDDMEQIVANDLNVYDQYGNRIATTQPMIIEAGVGSDLMNALALDSLKTGKLSKLIIREKVGEMEYFSAYHPISDNGKQPIGYVNVPFLARQDQLDAQVVGLLTYLANIYLLVFLLINVVAVVISSTITKPLSMIQHRLSSTTLGNMNEPIAYESKDEIGAIVSAYNQMVSQLGVSEDKLKQSQRELAWRQMARQVAHEIKNPLTPMKLSIQHLTRAWDENTPRLHKMFPKVMKTLLVQIDSMVRIANSFSEFAKMPEPVKNRVKVNDVLLEVVDLYTQSEEAIWLIDIPKEEFWTLADRDQLSRSFNNIIKNGLQAVEENGIIHISMRIVDDVARIEIKDNGKGMSEDVQKKVFEPSFSTKSSGMGLGLAIVKRIIEQAGGTINFLSEEGRGTTFVIEMPSEDSEANWSQLEEELDEA